MKLPLYQTLRAVGQGAVMGTVISVAIATTYWLFGDAGLIGLTVVAGPGLLVLSYALERRAKRAQKESK